MELGLLNGRQHRICATVNLKLKQPELEMRSMWALHSEAAMIAMQEEGLPLEKLSLPSQFLCCPTPKIAPPAEEAASMHKPFVSAQDLSVSVFGRRGGQKARIPAVCGFLGWIFC